MSFSHGLDPAVKSLQRRNGLGDRLGMRCAAFPERTDLSGWKAEDAKHDWAERHRSRIP